MLRIPKSFGESYGSGQGGSFNRLGSPIRERHSNRDEVDVFSKSEKWLPNPPTPDTKSWTTREQEIEGFYSYIQALRSWSMLASERLANEISQAMSWPEEIITSTLTPGQQARSAKLFALLRTAFAAHPRVDALIRAFEAGAPIHNSPMTLFGSCGFELLRVLGLEFSLRTRTEAICLRSEVMKKDFRIDARGTHVVSDLLRAMAVETSRYDKLTSTLPPTVPRTDLLLNESDQALILIRNLPADARQYVLLHAQDDGLTALREAGLKYERQQRLYSELGAVAGKLRQVQEGESGAESDDEGAVDAIGTGDRSKRCTKCGKRHETSKCKTDMTNITCMEGRPRILEGVLVRFRKTENHLQRVLERVRKERCLKSLKVMENRKVTNLLVVQIRLPWFLLDPARWSVRLRSLKLLRWILHLSMFRTLFVMISFSNQNLKQ